MEIPNRQEARVDLKKITEYLLNPAHADGASKAAFFIRFGFDPARPEVLLRALRDHGCRHPVAGIVESPSGSRYIVDGRIDSPDGRHPLVRTVWVLETEKKAPRLITAYPIRRSEAHDQGT